MYRPTGYLISIYLEKCRHFVIDEYALAFSQNSDSLRDGIDFGNCWSAT